MNAGVLTGLWQASVSAGIMILVAAALRGMLQGRASRRAFCLAWDMCLVRLLIPVSISSPWSVWQLLRPAPAIQAQAAPLVDAAGTALGVSQGSSIVAAAGTQETRAMVMETVSPAMWVWIVWLLGALALAVWFLAGHMLSRRIYEQSLPCRSEFAQDWLGVRPLKRKVRLRVCDRIASPLTYGLLKPVILLPATMNWEDTTALRCVLEHEFEHIRRFDTLRKALLCAAVCVYWFNPLVWLLYVLAGRDMELACDEAVLLSGEDRERYALALLSLEEHRESWALAGSHFSMNALEERITTIMKHKKISILAVVAVVAVMVVAMVAVAAAAPDDVKAQAGEAAGTSSQYSVTVADNGMISEDGLVVRDVDGETSYSLDGGQTWMSAEEYKEQGVVTDVKWWTAEEYEKWLEQEKQNLEECIGERAYTSTDGWFVWDRQKVDETIAEYEKILEDIRNGALYSRIAVSTEGGDASGEAIIASGTGEDAEWLAYEGEEGAMTVSDDDQRELFRSLEQYGLKLDDNGTITLDGQKVRTFVDGVELDDGGQVTSCVYTDSEGTVDVHTLYEAAPNGDGSQDPMGRLVGIAKNGDPQFNQGLIDSMQAISAAAGQTAQTTVENVVEAHAEGQNGEATYVFYDEAAAAEGSDASTGRTLEDVFAAYRPYGLVYDDVAKTLTYRGQPVSSFADFDAAGSAFSYTTDEVDGLKIRTQYDASGRLTGLTAE